MRSLQTTFQVHSRNFRPVRSTFGCTRAEHLRGAGRTASRGKDGFRAGVQGIQHKPLSLAGSSKQRIQGPNVIPKLDKGGHHL